MTNFERLELELNDNLTEQKLRIAKTMLIENNLSPDSEYQHSESNKLNLKKATRDYLNSYANNIDTMTDLKLDGDVTIQALTKNIQDRIESLEIEIRVLENRLQSGNSTHRFFI